MSALDVRSFDTYDAFARQWHAATLADAEGSLDHARERGLLNEQGTRQLWQLVGLLDDEELVIQLPEWLAEAKVGGAERAVPTLFVGRVARETEKAIRLEHSAAARPLMSIAHRIHSLEVGLATIGGDADRRSWLERRLQEQREAFETRDGLVGLKDEWIPTSLVQLAIRRETPDAARS